LKKSTISNNWRKTSILPKNWFLYYFKACSIIYKII